MTDDVLSTPVIPLTHTGQPLREWGKIRNSLILPPHTPCKFCKALSVAKAYTPPALKPERNGRELKSLLTHNYRVLSTAISQPSVGKEGIFTPGKRQGIWKGGMKNKVLQSHAVWKLSQLKQQAETGLPFGFLQSKFVEEASSQDGLVRMRALIPPLPPCARQLLLVPAVPGHAAD